MTRSQLARLLAAKTGLSDKRALEIVRAMFDAVRDGLVRGERVEVRGFGSFRAPYYGPRSGSDPRHQKSFKIPGRRLPRFKPALELAERVGAGLGVPPAPNPAKSE